MRQDPAVRQQRPCARGVGGGAGCSAVVDEVVRGSNDPRVWRPICFLFIFAACPQNTDAWNSFLFGEPASGAGWANASTAVLSNSSSLGSTESPVLQPLALPEETLGYIGAVTTVAQASGALFYRLCLKRFTLRRLFLVIVVASSLLQLSQLILISRLNVQLGLPDVAFAIGDDAILEVSRELLAMPMMVMMAALCPSRDLTLFEPWTHRSAGPLTLCLQRALSGAASTVFALLTSVQMAGATLAGSLSAGLTAALGITLDDYSRLWQLTVVCTTIRLCTVLCVGLVPLRSPSALEAESEALQASGASAAVETARIELHDTPMLRAQDASSEHMSEHMNEKGRTSPEPLRTNETAGLPEQTALQAQQLGSEASSRRRCGNGPKPWGTILLFSLIVASLLWSLYNMFSGL